MAFYLAQYYFWERSSLTKVQAFQTNYCWSQRRYKDGLELKLCVCLYMMLRSAKRLMASSFPAHSPPFHVLAWGFDSWCLLTESWFRTGCLQIPSALQQQMSGSFRKDLAASSPLFGVDQPPWLQETLNNRKRQAEHSWLVPPWHG